MRHGDALASSAHHARGQRGIVLCGARAILERGRAEVSDLRAHRSAGICASVAISVGFLPASCSQGAIAHSRAWTDATGLREEAEGSKVALTI
jgi:hypothetical protein